MIRLDDREHSLVYEGVFQNMATVVSGVRDVAVVLMEVDPKY